MRVISIAAWTIAGILFSAGLLALLVGMLTPGLPMIFLAFLIGFTIVVVRISAARYVWALLIGMGIVPIVTLGWLVATRPECPPPSVWISQPPAACYQFPARQIVLVGLGLLILGSVWGASGFLRRWFRPHAAGG